MNKDAKIWVVMIILSLFALLVVFYINFTQALNFLSDPLYGEGLGNLCPSEDGCREHCFVLGNRGRCDEYCQLNPSNPLCEKLYGEMR